MDYSEDDNFDTGILRDPNDPRTMECDNWAGREATRMRTDQPKRVVQVIRIEPQAKYRKVGANFIGPISLPNGQTYHPNPPWAFHCAVLADGIARDELYPNGLPLEDYKRIFKYWDDLAFVPDPNQ
ncbi:hypothetical protein PQR75_41400 [Paraburkholderia fungorum]|jgi:hypothetical protein|uniref:hypothetical protein n=1 Tax=Paraburkholderia fungorum TaxID=134537 RepID=UPI0038BC0AE6